MTPGRHSRHIGLREDSVKDLKSAVQNILSECNSIHNTLLRQPFPLH